MAKENTRPLGCLTYLAVYGLMVAIMYIVTTQKVPGDALTRSEAAAFHIAVVAKKSPEDKDGEIFAFSTTLDGYKNLHIDPARMSFLLPDRPVEVSREGANLHKITVLERHADWQLIEYHFGNTYSSKSRYRAYRDRVEPVSFHWVMSFGIFLNSIALVIPALLLVAIINFARRKASRAKDRTGAG